MWPAIIGGAMVAGGLFGALKNKSKASGIIGRGTDAINAVNVPTDEEMMYQIDQLVQQGILTPQDAQAIVADPSAFEALKTDPQFKQAQLDALQGLQGIAKEGGITASEKAQMAQIQDEVGTALRGEREAINQNAQARGIGGSGVELASKMGANQAATQAASRAAVDTAASARERALNALQTSGQLAGQMGSQDFQQQAERAKAIDAINKFNVTNKQQTEYTNVAARNAANATNLTEKQRIADANKVLSNEKRMYDASLPQVGFDNKMRKATAIAGQYDKQADVEEAKRERLDRLFGSLISGGGTIASMGGKK